MRKIYLILLLLLNAFLFSQDMDFSHLVTVEDGRILYAKRISRTDVWQKIVTPDKKQKLKNGKFVVKKTADNTILVRCDCTNSTVEDLTNNIPPVYAQPETSQQLIEDFTCHNLKYKHIGDLYKDWSYSISEPIKNGNYLDVWVKVIDISDNTTQEAKEGRYNLINPKTGESFEYNNREIPFTKTFSIDKVRVNCEDKKIGTIISFVYVDETNLLLEYPTPQYYNTQGKIEEFGKYGELIYNNVCPK